MNSNIEKTKKSRILIVEDNRMNQLVAKKLLGENIDNVEISIADNGKIAIDKLLEEDFDLILMDIQMPVMDGYTAAKYIRTEMNYSPEELPIIAMKVETFILLEDRYPDYGMQDCITHPLKPQELFEKIDFYLAKDKR